MEQEKPGIPVVIQGAPEHPEAAAWRAYHRNTVEGAPQRLEEAAKFLSGAIALTLTLTIDNDFFKSPDPAGAPAAPDAYAPFLLAAGIGLWVLSLTAALLVVFPFRYRYVIQSSESIQAMHTRVVRRKYAFLVAAVVCYLLALAAVAWVRLAALWP